MPADILIVDDEPSIVAPLRFLMQQQGHTVRIVDDGNDVMPAIRARCPDLVLLDVMLPSRSGFALCDDIRSDPDCGAMKIVLLTVKSREVDIEKGRALGANAYITKPFAIQEVVDTVEACLADG